MVHVLVVSRYFPPMSSAGASIRLVKFIKYAAKQGWKFTVVSQHPDYPVIDDKNHCEFLLEDVPPDVEILRIKNPIHGKSVIKRTFQRVFHQSSIPWGLSVVKVCQRKFSGYRPDLIFVNSPPFTNAAIGFRLSEYLGIPLIVDMKDDWIGSSNYLNKGELRKRIDQWIERAIFRKAIKVTVATKKSHDNFILRYPDLAKKSKFFHLPNGQDMDEFIPLFSRNPQKEGAFFRMVTTASGYQPGYRELTPILDTLKALFAYNPQARNLIQLEFIGDSVDPVYKQQLEEILSVDRITYTPTLNRLDLVERMWLADLFFLVQPKGNTTAVSGTLYEYWAVGKAPILLFSESGASSELIKLNNLGSHFQYNQVEEASQYIMNLLDGFSSSHPLWIKRDGAEAFDRRELALQMMKIWSDSIETNRKSDELS